MGSTSPAISVILPCHNLAGYVSDAIASLQAQEFRDFEALVVDDGSTDASVAAITAAIGRDTRFRLIRQSHSGLSAARNHGLDLARADVIGFLDGDDLYAPQFLGTLHQELVRSGADWIACAVSLFWPDGHRLDHPARHGQPLQSDGAAQWCDLGDARTVAQHFPSAWNKLYRRTLIDKTRFIDGAIYEDHPFFWTLACKARRIRYVPQPLYHYRRGRAGQITDQGDAGILQQIDRLQEVAAIARAGALEHIDQGLSQLATRLIHERLEPPTNPQLKAAFLDRAAQFFAQHALQWDRAGACDILPANAAQLDPGMRLHVLICAGPDSAISTTKAALARQSLPVWSIQCVNDVRPIAAMMAHLQPAGTGWIACLNAGDQPERDWALKSLEEGRAAQAACVISGAQFGAYFDTGFALPEDRLGSPDPAALVMQCRALAQLPKDLRQSLVAAPDPLAALALAAHLRPFIAVIASPMLHLGPRRQLDLPALADQLQQATRDLCPLDPSERACAFAHLAQRQMAQRKTRAARLLLAIRAGLARRRAGLPRPAPMPHLGPILQHCLGVDRTGPRGA